MRTANSWATGCWQAVASGPWAVGSGADPQSTIWPMCAATAMIMRRGRRGEPKAGTTRPCSSTLKKPRTTTCSNFLPFMVAEGHCTCRTRIFAIRSLQASADMHLDGKRNGSTHVHGQIDRQMDRQRHACTDHIQARASASPAKKSSYLRPVPVCGDRTCVRARAVCVRAGVPVCVLNMRVCASVTHARASRRMFLCFMFASHSRVSRC